MLIHDAFYAMQKGDDALVMPISLHTFLVGQPCALPHVRRVLEHISERLVDVWFTTPGDIFRHIEQLPPGTVPGDGKFQKSQRYLH